MHVYGVVFHICVHKLAHLNIANFNLFLFIQVLMVQIYNKLGELMA